LARLPASLADELRQAREAHEGLAVLAATVPVLTRLHNQREELRQARVRAQSAEEARQAIQTRGAALASEVERLRPTVEEASRARQQADNDATRAHTLLDQAAQSLAEIDQLQGAKLCRHCGQELTAGHVKEEKRRRQGELNEAKKRLRDVVAIQRASQEEERKKREQFASVEKELQAAREEYLNQRHQAEQARKDIERLERDCAAAFGELPDTFRSRVSQAAPSDWLTTSFPTEADLAAFRGQAAGLAAARQRVRQAEEAQEQRTQLLAQESAVAQALARLQAELPKDVQRVRQDHARLEAEEQALDRSLAARRAEDAEIQKHLERLTREREMTQQVLADLAGKLATEERTRQHIGQALNRALAQLSAGWRSAVEGAGLSRLYTWTQERDDLEQRGVEARWNELHQARLSLEMLRQELSNLEKQQEAFPEEARAEPALLQGRLAQARHAQQTRDEELAAAQQHRLLLQNQARQRQELADEILHLEKQHNNSKILATLLGRDRLQLHLVRQAERQVVDYANAVLDRLSGGQLHLRLVGEAAGDGTTAKALELEAYNRATGERPINVAFLSGSQKFRVAVSLALGIGQYASRQHRPIESVIIDEGFGCLDREGRQVMIQELQNLRGHLRCILLVSHQEDFASAFADGYRFELAEGSTRVTRFQQ
ncbi:MAG TPA: hypothetical protein VFA18_13975, partial [Gemmataceae bacterium]|nr:hypothetical protein [Gemmataceae bacterium]